MDLTEEKDKNSEERLEPGALSARTDSAPIYGTDPVGGTASAPSPLAQIDALAVSALSTKALARYHAYKEALLVGEQDEATILSSLTLFVWDLSEGR